jgi:hypothetical protein
MRGGGVGAAEAGTTKGEREYERRFHAVDRHHGLEGLDVLFLDRHGIAAAGRKKADRTACGISP